MATLLWTKPADAGLVPSCNGAEWLLPGSDEDEAGLRWKLDVPLYHSVCVRGRATHVIRLCRPAVLDPPLPPPASSLPLPIEAPPALRRSTRPRTQTTKAHTPPSNLLKKVGIRDKGEASLCATQLSLIYALLQNTPSQNHYNIGIPSITFRTT